MAMILCRKLKKRKYHTVGTVEISPKESKSIPRTQTHDRSISWFWYTGTSLKVAG